MKELSLAIMVLFRASFGMGIVTETREREIKSRLSLAHTRTHTATLSLLQKEQKGQWDEAGAQHGTRGC